jgi:hypothetical protein
MERLEAARYYDALTAHGTARLIAEPKPQAKPEPVERPLSWLGGYGLLCSLGPRRKRRWLSL